MHLYRLPFKLFALLHVLFFSVSCGSHESTVLPGLGRNTGTAIEEDSSPSGKMTTALRSGDEIAVRKMIDSGFGIETRLNRGRTPLLEAIAWNREIIVKFLLGRGADASARDEEGRDAFFYAQDKPTILKLLRPELGNELIAKLFIAVRANQFSEVKKLLQEGVEPNVHNEAGETPLTLAIMNRFTNVVRVLIQPGTKTELNFKNVAGRTPLRIARDIGAKDIEKFLLQRGAKEE
jgi:ankyrin repeat protein